MDDKPKVCGEWDCKELAIAWIELLNADVMSFCKKHIGCNNYQYGLEDGGVMK